MGVGDWCTSRWVGMGFWGGRGEREVVASSPGKIRVLDGVAALSSPLKESKEPRPVQLNYLLLKHYSRKGLSNNSLEKFFCEAMRIVASLRILELCRVLVFFVRPLSYKLIR